jgi:hypothetical protein
MPNLSSLAREAAERDAVRIMGRPRQGFDMTASDFVHAGQIPGFIAGFTECASRLPSETEIAETIAAGYDRATVRGKSYSAGYHQSAELAAIAAIALRNRIQSNNLIDKGGVFGGGDE